MNKKQTKNKQHKQQQFKKQKQTLSKAVALRTIWRIPQGQRLTSKTFRCVEQFLGWATVKQQPCHQNGHKEEISIC